MLHVSKKMTNEINYLHISFGSGNNWLNVEKRVSEKSIAKSTGSTNDLSSETEVNANCSAWFAEPRGVSKADEDATKLENCFSCIKHSQAIVTNETQPTTTVATTSCS